MNNRLKWSIEQLRIAVEESESFAQTLSRIGLKPAGGNYDTIKRAIDEFDIDTSHFKGHGWSRGKTFPPKRPIEDYLSNKYAISSHKLKNRLLREGFFERKCYSCGLETWLDSLIPLELEHKDGKHDNNSLDNLTLLCPNCHALTDTYRGKNIGKAV